MPDEPTPDAYDLESFDWSNVEKAVRVLEQKNQPKSEKSPGNAAAIIESRLQILIEHYAAPALLRGCEFDEPAEVAGKILAFMAALEAE